MSAAATIAAALGRAVRLDGDGRSWLCSCPLAGHGRGRGDIHPSLQIRDGDQRLLVRCYANCDPRDILAELRRRGLHIDGGNRDTHHPSRHPAPAPKRTIDQRQYEDQQRRKAAAMWARRKPIKGSIVETYLRSRGITLHPLPYATLGFLPPRGPDQHPAMIACFGLHDEPEPGVLGLPYGMVDSVHLTLLKPDGSGKANVEKPKIVIGSPRGRPIELAPPDDLLGLAITEGIEDGLTVHQATGLGVWAAGSAPFLPKLANAVPDYIDAVTIYAHADKAGQDGGHALAAALRARGNIEITIEGAAP